MGQGRIVDVPDIAVLTGAKFPKFRGIDRNPMAALWAEAEVHA